MTMMMMMKNPIVMVTCILLVSSLAVMASGNPFSPDECCFEYYPRVLPKRNVLSYKYTSDQCAKKAVIVKMKKLAEFCVNPSDQWVKGIIKAVQDRNMSSTGFN